MQPTVESLTKEITQLSRERRTIMLEQHTPAYARDPAGRRAIDLHWKRANNLRRALNEAGIDVPISVRTIVPHEYKYVSGLNVPTNYQIVCGKKQAAKFSTLQRKAKAGLNARNE
jgi:hypothetical protein